MPKKKSKTEEDDILKEIADKLKEIKDEESLDEEPEKSEPEEDIDMGALDFNQFIQPMQLEDIGAPVLERIAGAQPRPIFVGGIPQTPVPAADEEKESDEFKYVPGQETTDEPKYIESDSRISREPTPIDLRRAGREPTKMVPAANQEAFFRRSEPGSQIESPTIERVQRAERIDTGRAGREDIFKRETKYEKYKPKTPKSY
jgi:hypothetical protein